MQPIQLEFYTTTVRSGQKKKKQSEHQKQQPMQTASALPMTLGTSFKERLSQQPQDNAQPLDPTEEQRQTDALLQFVERPNCYLEVLGDTFPQVYQGLSQIHNVNRRVLLATMTVDALLYSPLKKRSHPGFKEKFIMELSSKVKDSNQKFPPSETFDQSRWDADVLNVILNNQYYNPSLFYLC